MKKRAEDTDQVVGTRIKTRRKIIGFTPQHFASLLGISYQQLYKYESGVNRVSSTQLAKIAKLLQTDISYFFDDKLLQFPSIPSDSFRASEIMNSPETNSLVKNYIAIPDTRTRMAVVELVTSITKFFARKAS
ncbi:MAG: helix-turn-helix transcriptional regulator [Pseudomonadota bacterium]